MPIPRVIHGLAKKRAQLVAELSHPQGRHEYCRQGIAAIDAVLPLWDVPAPVYVRRYIPKPAVIPHLVRRIVSALREQPMTTAQIMAVLLADQELDKAERRRLRGTLACRLGDMRREGRIVAEKGIGRKNTWRLASSFRP
jgi:hypothetical protein